jgi:hypothetical protein
MRGEYDTKNQNSFEYKDKKTHTRDEIAKWVINCEKALNSP